MNTINNNIDDLFLGVFAELTNRPFNVYASRSDTNGPTSEIIAAKLELTNPLARISPTETKGKLYSALGEFLWYMKADDSLNFIGHYIKEYQDEVDLETGNIYGAYGPRLFNSHGNINQVQNVIELLKERPTSRKAAIQLFEAKDIPSRKPEIPCTCTLQFLVRNKQLNMVVYMRSNDAFKGLPHDIFCFTMLQEVIARELLLDLGTYSHVAGSLHLYKSNYGAAVQYVNEGFQSTEYLMPKMPSEPLASLKIILEIEDKIRKGEYVSDDYAYLDPYWQDLALLLHCYQHRNNNDFLKEAMDRVKNPFYSTFIRERIR